MGITRDNKRLHNLFKSKKNFVNSNTSVIFSIILIIFLSSKSLSKSGEKPSNARSSGDIYILHEAQSFDIKKLKGTKITPLLYTIIEYGADKSFKFLTTNEHYEKDHRDSFCMFNSLPKEKIEYYHKINLNKPINYEKSEKNTLNYFYLSNRIDLLISKRKDKIAFFPWKTGKPTFVFDLKPKDKNGNITEEKSIKDGLNAYCRKLAYNGVIIKVDKKKVYVK